MGHLSFFSASASDCPVALDLDPGGLALSCPAQSVLGWRSLPLEPLVISHLLCDPGAEGHGAHRSISMCVTLFIQHVFIEHYYMPHTVLGPWKRRGEFNSHSVG